MNTAREESAQGENSGPGVDRGYRERLRVAVACAREAGAILLEARSHTIEVRSKGKNDAVTQLDTESERLITARIRAAFPGDAVLGEEDGLSGPDPAHSGLWIIDPIDGTDNFIHDMPDYTISIGYRDPVEGLAVGVIFCPAQGELYHASAGGGAFLNGKPIAVSSVSSPADAISLVAPPLRIHERAPWYFSLMQKIFLQTRDDRNFGSAALHLAYVACGRADSFYEIGLKAYDVAAGFVILAEAGGRWSGFDPDEDPMATGRVLATNGKLHDWYLGQIRSAPW